MDKLALQVLKAKSGEGSIVNVIGEAGIGKSRLITELKNHDAAKNTMILEGRALSMGRNLSFYPVIEILKRFANIGENNTEPEQLSKLESAIRSIHPEQVDEIFPFVATLMGMKLTGKPAERVKGIEGEALEKLIYKNLRDLILKSAEQTALIFIIEDLHWADTSSIDLVISLFRLVEKKKILFINVFRPHHPETGEKLQKAVKEDFPGLYTEIVLNRLDANLSDRLIDNLLKIDGLPAHMRELINKRAEGNPFFIEEVARAMIDEGAIELKQGRFIVTGKIESMTIPHTIQELLMSRIDRLDEKTKTLLKTASVIGRHFFHKILTEVVDAVDDLDETLGYLQENQMIRQGNRLDEIEYLFKHALAQETTYESILLSKRKALHLKVAESIETVFNERLHEFYGMLAYHYSQGENLDKVEEYVMKAGEEALKSSASSEAIFFYQEALELYTQRYGDQVNSLKVAMMEKNLAIAFHSKADFRQSIDYCDRAIKSLGYKEASRTLPITISCINGLLSLLKELYIPKKKPKKIPTDIVNLIFDLFFLRGSALLVVSQTNYLFTSLMIFSFLNKFDKTKSQSVFKGLTAYTTLFSFTGISQKIGRKILSNSQNILENNPYNINSSSYFQLQETFYNVISGNKAIQPDIRSINYLLEIGDSLAGVSMLYLSTHSIIQRGDFVQAEDILQMFTQIAVQYNYAHAQADFHEFRALISYYKHGLSGTKEHINKAITIREKLDEKGMIISLLGMQLQTEIMTMSFDDCEKTINKTKALVKIIGKLSVAPIWYFPYPIGVTLYYQARLERELSLGNKSNIAKYKKQMLKWGKEATGYAKKIAIYRTHAYLLRGQSYWLLNKQKKALKWFDKSIKSGVNLGAKPELSKTYMEVGKSLLDPKSKYKHLNGISAEEYLEKARVLFDEMELKWDLEQLERVKAESSI